MATGSTFPIFIRPELQDGAPAFAELKRIAGQSSKQAAESFKSDFREVTSVISNALTKGIQGGKLNLDVSQLKQAAAEAKLFGTAINETLRTAQSLAKETGDTSGETRQFILAMEAASRAQDENRRGIDAQIATYSRLQSALDATVGKNDRLAQSYRETYAEAARMAQAEVANSRLGSTIAPAMGTSAISNGAGYGELEKAARAADAYERQLAELRQQVDPLSFEQARLNKELAFAEAAYRKGDISSEQLQARTHQLNNALVTVEGGSRAAAAGMNNLGFQIQDIAQGIALGVNPFTILAQQGGQLASSLQQIFEASQPVTGAMTAAASSVTGLNTATTSAKSSTLQLAAADVAAVPATNTLSAAARVETTALAGVATTATAAAGATTRMAVASKAAAFAAGPFGAGLIALVSVLGMFALSSRKSGDATDDASKSTYDFTVVLDTRMMSITKFSDAINQLSEATRGLIDTQALLADSMLASAAGGVADIERRIADVDRQLKGLGTASSGVLSIIPGFGESPETIGKRKALQAQRSVLEAERAKIETARATAEMAIAQRRVDETIDKAKGITASFERQIAELRQRRQESIAAESSDPATSFSRQQSMGARYLSKSEFDRRYAELRRNQDTALDAQRKADRAPNSTTRSPAQVLADFSRELEERGVKTISGYRTAAQQNALFKQGVTPADGYSRPSAHQSYRAVDIDPRTFNEASIYAAGEAAGVRGLKILTESGGRKHLSFTGAGKPGEADPRAAERAQRDAEMAQRAAEQLQRSIDEASESVANLWGQFDRAPRDVDRAANAVIDLNQAIDEADKKLKEGGLTDAQAGVVKNTKSRAEQTRDQLIPDFLKRPLTDQIGSSRDLIDAQRLLVQGRQAEYDVMEDQVELARLLGAETLDQLDDQIKQRGITKEMLDAYYDQRRVLRQQNIEIQNQQEQQQILLDIVEDIKSATKNAIYDLFDRKGLGAAKNFLNSLYDTTKRQLTEEIYEQVFGDMFRKEKLKILGLDQVDETGKAMASAIRVTIDPIKDLGNAAAQAAAQLRGSITGANDNQKIDKVTSSLPGLGGKAGSKTAGAADFLNSDIIVNGYRSTDNLGGELKKLNKTAAEGFGKNGALAKSLSWAGEIASTAMRGAAYGEAASGVLRSLGIKQSGIGGQIGGALGGVLGKELFGKALGSVAGPLGGIVGGILGGALGGLMKKTPRGFATIGGGSDGNLAITGTGGNSNSAIKAGNQAAGATMDTLAQIAQALGGTYDAAKGSVSIGRSGDSWHVDTSGRGKLKKSQGGFDFDDDYEAAVRFATMDLIKDGVISGLRASTQRLLQQGKDIDSALQKAVDFESVFQRLKEYRDPVGAALDNLDKEFTRLKGIFAEAGASTAEYADLEALYGIEREKAIKEAAERLTASLKSLYDDLTIGDNGRSLRERLSAAQANYDPLKARVLAGDTTAYDAFAEAARSLLDIQREFSGSQTPYFNLLDEITKITKDRIDAEKNVSAIAENRDSPFNSSGKATGANDNAPVVSAIQQQTADLLRGFAGIVGYSGSTTVRGYVTNDIR